MSPTTGAAITEPPIRAIQLPTPFSVGTVNVYLVGRPPLTLIDSGPDYAPALAALERALSSSSRGWRDIGRVLLTHHHVDHVGLAHVVKARSGAEVVAHASLADVLPNVLESMELDEAYAERLMRAYGFERERVRNVRRLLAEHRRYAGPVEVDRIVDEGDVVDGLRVAHRPGHSFSDIVARDDGRQVAFVGDHLLAHISSNALAHRPPAGEPDRSVLQALVTYRRSLERSLLELPDVAYTGHGPRIDDARALIRARLLEQDRRTESVLDAVRGGAETIQQLIDRFWPRLDASQLFLAFSEMLGHVGRLVERGRVEIDDLNQLTVVEEAATGAGASPNAAGS